MWRRPVPLGNGGDGRVAGQLLVESTTSHRAIGQEAYPLVLTVFDDASLQRLAKERAQPVLNGCHRDEFLRRSYLLHRYVGESHPAHLARVAQLGECADAVSEGDVRVRGMELVKVDAVDR